MTTIVTRGGKGSPLTDAEGDANFTNLNDNKLETNIPLGAGVDLNTIITSGVYFQTTNANASGGTNYPAPYAGMLEVYSPNSQHVMQRYTTYGIPNNPLAGRRVYVRAYYSASGWVPWQKAAVVGGYDAYYGISVASTLVKQHAGSIVRVGGNGYTLTVDAVANFDNGDTLTIHCTCNASQSVTLALTGTDTLALNHGVPGANVPMPMTLRGGDTLIMARISASVWTVVFNSQALLAKAQNLADLPDIPTARTNLDVYSKSEAIAAIGGDDFELITNPHGSIFQEGGSAVTVANGNYFVDQWMAAKVSSTGVLQAGGTPSTLSTCDTQAIYIKTTTAQASLAAGDNAVLLQPIEGYYSRRLLYGSSAARGSWFRFRAVCTQSATCSVAIRNAANNRSWVQTFAVSTAPTDYSFFVPGDTTGVWPTTNVQGANVVFTFAAGTSYQTATLGAWQAGNFVAGTAQTNLMGVLNAQLTVTDVSWKTSQVLLPFKAISYPDELQRCQRYFVRHGLSSMVGMGFNYATSGSYIDIRTPVAMRGAPTILSLGATQLLSGGSAVAVTGIGNIYWNPSYGVAAQIIAAGGGLTVGQGTALYTNSGAVDVNARM